jgi:hypothetical protein
MDSLVLVTSLLAITKLKIFANLQIISTHTAKNSSLYKCNDREIKV